MQTRGGNRWVYEWDVSCNCNQDKKLRPKLLWWRSGSKSLVLQGTGLQPKAIAASLLPFPEIGASFRSLVLQPRTLFWRGRVFQPGWKAFFLTSQWFLLSNRNSLLCPWLKWSPSWTQDLRSTRFPRRCRWPFWWFECDWPCNLKGHLYFVRRKWIELVPNQENLQGRYFRQVKKSLYGRQNLFGNIKETFQTRKRSTLLQKKRQKKIKCNQNSWSKDRKRTWYRKFY